MPKILNSKNVFFELLIICFLFSFSKLDIQIENITSIGEKTNYNQTRYFKIDLGNTSKNYIKVQIEGKDEYAIIYYKNDSSFKNRNQIVKSSSITTIMWLNKAQINETFYLSVMCSNQICDYTLLIDSKEKLELGLGQSYTYYVTEQTKNMIFSIKVKTNLDKNNPEGQLSLWAKGYQNINSELKSESLKNLNEIKRTKDGFEAYLIPVKNNDEIILNFNIDGIPGDLINIGVLLFDKENICKTPINNFSSKISGLLIKKNMEKSCFIFPGNEKPNINTLLEYESSITFEKYTSKDKQNIYCLKINPNDNEALYSFHYKKEEKINDKINILPPLKLGQFYQLNMRKGENIGLIPMLLDKDFKYLTYKTLEKKGNYKAYMLNCNNYPFCNIPEIKEYLINYNAASRTFLKKDFRNIFSPIDKNQTMIIIECDSDFCIINANIYTEKNKIAIEPLISYQNFLKDNEDQLIPTYFYKNALIYANLIYTSEIGIGYSTNCYVTSNNNKNQYFYEITNKNNNHFSIPDFTLNIDSKEKVVYSVAVANITKNNNVDEINISPGMNYNIKIDSNHSNDTIVKIMNSNQDNIYDDHIYYLSFYSDNCSIEVNRLKSSENKYILKNNKRFYDYFYNISSNNNEFKITKLENNDYCLVDVSLFKYKNKYNELNSFYLLKEKPHTFLFDQNNNQVKYRYLLVEKDVDLEIIITPTNVTNCNITSLSINDNETKNNKTLEQNTKNSIKVNDIDKYCKNDFQPCKIEVTLIAEDLKENPTVEISVSHKNKSNKIDKKALYIILSITGGSVLLVIIIVIIICICKSKNSLDGLSKQVNAISYVEEKDKDDDKDEDLLE